MKGNPKCVNKVLSFIKFKVSTIKARSAAFYCNCPPGLQDWFVFRGLGLHKELSLIKLIFLFFSIFIATFRTENNFCHRNLAGGELPAVSPNWMFDASLRIEKIDQKIVSVNDIDVRDAVMTSATLILSGTPNPQSTTTTRKVVIGLVFLGF